MVFAAAVFPDDCSVPVHMAVQALRLKMPRQARQDFLDERHGSHVCAVLSFAVLVAVKALVEPEVRVPRVVVRQVPPRFRHLSPRLRSFEVRTRADVVERGAVEKDVGLHRLVDLPRGPGP